MTDISDRGTAREEELRIEALLEQERRAGLTGKTVADSAILCRVCLDAIPYARRKAFPGVQTCVDCQTELERATSPG